MARTYEPIATTTLGSSAASYTFSSIPSTYTDIILIANAKGTSAESIKMQFNGDTGSNYSFTYVVNTASGRATNTAFALGGYVNTTENIVSIVNIQNYANTTTYKTTVDRRGGASNFVGMDVSLWRSTAAITSILLAPEAGSFAAGSTFTLYGIKAA